jgi:hypothetical protein
MAGRSDRQQNTNGLCKSDTPYICRQHYYGRIEVACTCAYTCHVFTINQDLPGCHTFKDSCTIVTGAFGKAVRRRHWICHTSTRLETGQFHSFTTISRCYLANFIWAHKLCINTLILLYLHIGTQCLGSLLVSHDDHSGGDEATISTDKLIEMLENGKAFLSHANGIAVGVMLPDDSSRTSRSAITQGLPLQQHNLATSLFCKMVGDTGTHYPASNDDNVSRSGHSFALQK